MAAVLSERGCQDRKWGVDFHLPMDTYARILGEEFGEICRALNDSEEPLRVYEECIQTAAVAVRMAVACLLRARK